MEAYISCDLMLLETAHAVWIFVQETFGSDIIQKILTYVRKCSSQNKVQRPLMRITALSRGKMEDFNFYQLYIVDVRT